MDDRWPALTVHDEDLIAERVVSEHDEPLERERDARLTADPPAATDVLMVEPFTEDHPATFEITFTNTSENDLEVGFGPTPPFGGYVGHRDDRSMIQLLPLDAETRSLHPDRLVPNSQTDGVWRAKESFVIPDLLTLRVIAPGESLRGRYALVAPATEDEPAAEGGRTNDGGGFLRGTYTFEESYRLEGWAEEGSFLRWQFSISVT